MDAAKIQLSAEERELISNTGWILTKNRLMASVNQLLLLVLERQQHHLLQLTNLPDAVRLLSPKISKGENYLGLPYVVLDHPRLFAKENTCAVRTMFWWGHHFSTTLQLEGSWKLAAQSRIIGAFAELQERDMLVCVFHEPWQHHLGSDNFKPITEFSEAAFALHIRNHPFIKITAVLPLSDWDFAVDKLAGDFAFLTRFVVT